MCWKTVANMIDVQKIMANVVFIKPNIVISALRWNNLEHSMLNKPQPMTRNTTSNIAPIASAATGDGR